MTDQARHQRTRQQNAAGIQRPPEPARRHPVCGEMRHTALHPELQQHQHRHGRGQRQPLAGRHAGHPDAQLVAEVLQSAQIGRTVPGKLPPEVHADQRVDLLAQTRPQLGATVFQRGRGGLLGLHRHQPRQLDLRIQPRHRRHQIGTLLGHVGRLLHSIRRLAQLGEPGLHVLQLRLQRRRGFLRLGLGGQGALAQLQGGRVIQRVVLQATDGVHVLAGGVQQLGWVGRRVVRGLLRRGQR